MLVYQFWKSARLGSSKLAVPSSLPVPQWSSHVRTSQREETQVPGGLKTTRASGNGEVRWNTTVSRLDSQLNIRYVKRRNKHQPTTLHRVHTSPTRQIAQARSVRWAQPNGAGGSLSTKTANEGDSIPHPRAGRRSISSLETKSRRSTSFEATLR